MNSDAAVHSRFVHRIRVLGELFARAATRSTVARAAREGTSVAAGQVLVALAGLIGVRLMTECVPPKLLGDATLLLGAIALGRNLFIAPLMNAQLRFHPTYARDGHGLWFTRQVRAHMRRMTVALISIFMPGFALWRWLTIGHFDVWVLLLLCLFIVFDAAKSLEMGRLNAERRQATLALWCGSEAWAIVVATVVAMMLAKQLEVYLAAQVMAVGGCLLLFKLISVSRDPATVAGAASGHGPVPAASTLRQQFWTYGAPFIPLAVLVWITNIGDRYILGSFMTGADVGVYSMIYSLASRPMLLASGTTTTWFRPVLFQAVSHHRARRASAIFAVWFALIFVIGLTGAGLLWLFSEDIGRVFLAPAYRQHVREVLVWVYAGYVFFSLAQIIENRLLSFNRSGQLLLPSLIGGLSNILINLYLIPRYGIVGAAQATAASFALQLLCLAIILWKTDAQSHAAGPVGAHSDTEREPAGAVSFDAVSS